MKTQMEFKLTAVREDLDLCDFTTDNAPELYAQFDNYLHEYKIKTDWNLVVHDCEDDYCNVILHCNDLEQILDVMCLLQTTEALAKEEDW